MSHVLTASVLTDKVNTRVYALLGTAYFAEHAFDSAQRSSMEHSKSLTFKRNTMSVSGNKSIGQALVNHEKTLFSMAEMVGHRGRVINPFNIRAVNSSYVIRLGCSIDAHALSLKITGIDFTLRTIANITWKEQDVADESIKASVSVFPTGKIVLNGMGNLKQARNLFRTIVKRVMPYAIRGEMTDTLRACIFDNLSKWEQYIDSLP